MSLPNKKKSYKAYAAGRLKEYQLVSELKKLGWISFRTAGSHSPIDVVGIDLKKKKIHLYQLKVSKQKYFDKKELEAFKKIPKIENVIKHFVVHQHRKGIIFEWVD